MMNLPVTHNAILATCLASLSGTIIVGATMAKLLCNHDPFYNCTCTLADTAHALCEHAAWQGLE